jgi:23S rRNA pseudouridine2605 synthase
MIAEGRVALNGAPIDTPATVLPNLAGVTVDGDAVAAPEPARLFLFHKPVGVLTAERDAKGRPTIYDRLPPGLPRLIPVGRLDYSTEGLLLMTTDGGLKRQLELPATGVERAYRARAYGKVSQPQLEELIEGIEIEGVRYGSIDANIERRTGANVWIELILKEGKNREVRRVLEHLGLEVSRLIRTRYGPFLLGDLKPGEIGEVRRHDVESFQAEPTRRDLPQPARRQATPPVELVTRPAPAGTAAGKPMRREPQNTRRQPPGAPLERAPRAASAEQGDAAAPKPRPQRPGRPPSAKDQPRQRADGTLATRGAGGRTNRSRTFRETRADAEPAPARPAGARTANPRSAEARSADRRTEGPRAAGPRSVSPRAPGAATAGPRTPGARPSGSRPTGSRPSGPGKPRPKTPRGAR